MSSPNCSDSSTGAPVDGRREEAKFLRKHGLRIFGGLGSKESDNFVRCRTGLQLQELTKNLRDVMDEAGIGISGDFVLVPLARRTQPGRQLAPFSELTLPKSIWRERVAIDLGAAYNSEDSIIEDGDQFERRFHQALYLSPLLIVMDGADFEGALADMAGTIIRHHRELTWNSLILLRVPLSPHSQHISNLLEPPNPSCHARDRIRHRAWHQWDAFRSYVDPDVETGVCLEIERNLPGNLDELVARWKKEPVRMIVLDKSLFTLTSGLLRLEPNCTNFIRQIMALNSLKTCLVVKGVADGAEARAYMEQLDQLADQIMSIHLNKACESA